MIIQLSDYLRLPVEPAPGRAAEIIQLRPPLDADDTDDAVAARMAQQLGEALAELRDAGYTFPGGLDLVLTPETD